MGHELNGDWTLWVVQAVSAGGALRLVPDGKLELKMTNAASGVIEAGSKHGANALTGSAAHLNGRYSISIREQVTGGMTPTYRPYEGFLIDRVDVTGGRVMIMAGFRRPVSTLAELNAGKVSKKKGRRKSASDAQILVGQEEGTWVATLP